MTKPSAGRHILFAVLAPFTVPFLVVLTVAAAAALLLVGLAEAASTAWKRLRRLLSRTTPDGDEPVAAEIRQPASGGA